jgi:DNA mismatch repair protein MutS
MTELAERLERAGNATVAVKEWDGEVIFLHEVRRGAADRSYGVQVARLAGLPDSVVERARVVLDALEKGEREGKGHQKALIDDLPLFSAVARMPEKSTKASELEKKMAEVNPDDLTPRDALALLYDLKALVPTK